MPVGECSICLEPLATQQCAVLMANGLRACNAHFYHEACAAQLARWREQVWAGLGADPEEVFARFDRVPLAFGRRPFLATHIYMGRHTR